MAGRLRSSPVAHRLLGRLALVALAAALVVAVTPFTLLSGPGVGVLGLVARRGGLGCDPLSY